MPTLKRCAAVVCLLALAQAVQAQQSQAPQPLPEAPHPGQGQSGTPVTVPTKPEHVRSAHHIFWVIPNYREDENGGVF
ncbi:MAG TPA: hypothetical protein VJN48_15680 [Terriglobales bacterium]|nr:hypothetical protein [Terriglobales bacterium]